MRYVTTFFLISSLSCLGCLGCGGLTRSAFGILTESKSWATPAGWSVGMLSVAVLGIAIVGIAATLARHRMAADRESEETPAE